MRTAALRIRLLGELDVRYGGIPLPPLDSARAASLLAYLLLNREAPQPRQHVAFLLWPDSAEPQARTNLRHVLHNLRRAFPLLDQYVEVTPRTLRWRTDAPYWLDVAAFEEAVARAEGEAADQVAALRQAVELYAGDVLEGCYDEWLLDERERLRQRYLEALERLAALLAERGEHAEAVRHAERLLHHDPLHEETYRLLMRLHDARGDRARALRVYHVCTATLARELGVEPSAATQEAYEALLPIARDGAAAVPAATPVGRSPLVGRASEWHCLTALWRTAERGRAQLVLVTGEPGVGKTRLIEELRAWCAHRGAAAAEARSYAAEGALAYGLVVMWLRSEALHGRLERLDRAHLTELARLLPELRSEVPGLAPPEALSEGEQRQRLFDAAARALLGLQQPLLLVADDLQWCDRESLQFLHYLLRVDPGARVLVAATARREEVDQQHPLNDLLAGLRTLEHCLEIDLGRLSREDTAMLADRLAGRPLAGPDADQLYAETEGNPLLVVEALRAGWRRGDAGRRWMSPKVQAVLESRLAQLSEPARDLVGVAATIGREFTADLLARASDADDGALVGSLDELWRRRIVREHGVDAYDFSHDKLRETAYLALSPPRRRHLHLRVAQALEQLHARDPGPVSGQLAAHYERAGAADQAITWYRRAAEAARQLHANAEVVRLLGRALDLVRTLPESPARHARELALLMELPAALGWVEGWGSERLAAVHQRALELVRMLGIEPAAPLVRSLAIASLSRRDFQAARTLGEQLYARGERDADDVLCVEASYVLGIVAFWQGEFAAARTHFAAAVDRYRPEYRRTHLRQYGLDPKVICLSRLGNTLWFLGNAGAATRARDAALALADEVGHPFSRTTALVFAALLALEMRDPDGVRAYTALLLAEQAQHEARPNQIATEHFGGYVDVLEGRAKAGIARIQRALADTRQADQAPGMRAHALRVLLEACALAGDARHGLAAADWALAAGDAVRLWEAETRRLRAAFLAALGASSSEIEAELGRALHVARQQGALLFELRTAASLLHYRLGHHGADGVQEARDLLAALVGRFGDAQDTQDLRAATALLSRR